MSDESAHLAAVLAALTTGGAVPYDLGKVPGMNGNTGTIPSYYTEVTVSRRFGGNFRGDALATTVLYRGTTRAVAKSASDARNLRRLTGLALENVALTVGGGTTTPLMFESEEIIGPDDGWLSGLTLWTWAI